MTGWYNTTTNNNTDNNNNNDDDDDDDKINPTLNPTCRTVDGKEASGRQMGVWANRAQPQQLRHEIANEKWQGKLFKSRWEDDQLSRNCFDWLKEWKTGPANTIAAVRELYPKLLPTKLYHHHKKTGINTSPDVLFLSDCSTLAQTKYLARHSAALKILLVYKVPPWHFPVQPKPLYKNERT